MLYVISGANLGFPTQHIIFNNKELVVCDLLQKEPTWQLVRNDQEHSRTYYKGLNNNWNRVGYCQTAVGHDHRSNMLVIVFHYPSFHQPWKCSPALKTTVLLERECASMIFACCPYQSLVLQTPIWGVAIIFFHDRRGKPQELWSMFPLTRVPFWHRFFEPHPFMAGIAPCLPIGACAILVFRFVEPAIEPSGGKKRSVTGA